MPTRNNMGDEGLGAKAATRSTGTQVTSPASQEGNTYHEYVGIPVQVVFADQRLTMASFTELMESMEALLTIGMAEPYELTQPRARAKLADSVVIKAIHKESPLEILMDLQGSVAAVTSFVTLAGGLIALRPLYATQQLKAAKADAAREKEKLKQKIARDLVSQYDALSKKKKKKLLSNKKFRKLIEQAAEGVLSIESVSSEITDASDEHPTQILNRP
ncbi:hypothetical protein [Arthrobacter oryzae]|uniref:hypothetical protein n=1 Tax=Arthrobacter oryzae TaxID=409290 RepID=UPI002785B7F2|nr:hypothetical protein [Arthrobacter oryzae]MDQ0078239.1 hypothetical protein [Arthrobacter oryzae]